MPYTRLALLAACFQMTIFALYGQSRVIRIKSAYQEDSTAIRIVSTAMQDTALVRLVFVLPVEEAKTRYKYGSGIEECQKLIEEGRVAENVVFIQPDYVRMPWYGNHPADTSTWQLSYTKELIGQMKAVHSGKRIAVYLLGFSKSGWGSMSLLLHHPELIDGIMVWDAPLAANWNEKWGMQQVFDNQVHFMANYHLMRYAKDELKVLHGKTIIIGGYDLFEKESTAFLKLLDSKGIHYLHTPDLHYKHEWNKEWISQLLFQGGLLKH